MIKQSPHLNKNLLLEPRWIAKNLKILDQNQNKISELPTTLRSEEYKRKIDVEKDLSLKILNYLRNK